jgi:NhaP-type Na+/H+ or K+/H+ antiporter
VLAAAVLALRRLPVVAAIRPLLRPWARGADDLLFLGWFGPVGVAAIFYAGVALRTTGLPEAWSVSSLIITASVVAHGLTATPFTVRYGRRASSE